MSDAESAEAPDIEALMTVITKPPSAKKKARKEGQSLDGRSLQRIDDAEKEHVEIGSDGSDAAAKPIVLVCEDAVLTENVSDAAYASKAIRTLVEQFKNGENRMANLDTEEKKDQAVINFVAISTKPEVGEDEATIPDLVDELYKLCVYLLHISNVCRSTAKESTVMKDTFGENPKNQQIFVTRMIVLQRNTRNDTWDAEADVKVLQMLLFADIKRRTDAPNGKNEAPPLALESAKLNEVFGEEAKALTEPFDVFGALMLAVYIMSAPSGTVLGDFIKRLEEDKDRWTAAYNTLGAMLFNGTKVSAFCRLTASCTDRFTNILLSRRRVGCWKLRRPRRINGILPTAILVRQEVGITVWNGCVVYKL
jgi:hypothetical protein